MHSKKINNYILTPLKDDGTIQEKHETNKLKRYITQYKPKMNIDKIQVNLI